MLGKQLPIPAVASPNNSKQNNRFTCICCRIKFDSGDLQRKHFKTEWHLYNLKRRVCDLEPIDLNGFDEIQNQKLRQEYGETSNSHAETTSNDEIMINRNQGLDGKNHDVHDDDEDDDDWEIVDEDQFEDELDDLLEQIITPNTCLFCDKRSPTISANLEHMDSSHGFFIPERRFLIDLEGLLEYLGFKVGVSSVCLWCNKQLSSKQGARLHMTNKDHCKIFYDQERAITEFKEFYDYSTQETFEMRPKGIVRLPGARPFGQKARPSRVLFHVGTSKCETGAMITSKKMKSFKSLEQRNIKKFDAYRAKIALRCSAQANSTLRQRFRAQNPI